jgi:hypothetical protein
LYGGQCNGQFLKPLEIKKLYKKEKFPVLFFSKFFVAKRCQAHIFWGRGCFFWNIGFDDAKRPSLYLVFFWNESGGG